MNSDYLFDNFLQFYDFRLTPLPAKSFAELPDHSKRTFWQNSVECAVTAILAWRSENTAFVSL